MVWIFILSALLLLFFGSSVCEIFRHSTYMHETDIIGKQSYILRKATSILWSCTILRPNLHAWEARGSFVPSPARFEMERVRRRGREWTAGLGGGWSSSCADDMPRKNLHSTFELSQVVFYISHATHSLSAICFCCYIEHPRSPFQKGLNQRFAKRGKRAQDQARSGLWAPVVPIAYYVFKRHPKSRFWCIRNCWIGNNIQTV